MAGFPEFSLRDYADYPRKFEAFLNDHFPFRGELIRAHSLTEYTLFHAFSDSNVVVGKDDWFFYNPKSATERNAVRDYKGIDGPDETELAELTRNLENFRDWLAERGIEFVIVLSPNKANLFPEYLPEGILRVGDASRGDVTAAYLREHSDLTFYYAKDVLEAAKGDAPLYFKHDSHWNQYGAFLAARDAAKQLFNADLPEPDFTFFEQDFGELAEMVRLNGVLREPYYVEMGGEGTPQFEVKMNWGRWTNREYIPKEGGERHLMVIGDSFGGDFVPYLVPLFSQVSFRRFDNDYSYHDVLDKEPDIVMLELTERLFVNEQITKYLQTEQ